MKKKKKKTLLLIAAGLFVPLAIAGTTFLAISVTNNKSNVGNELKPGEDGKIDLNVLPLDFSILDGKEFDNQIKSYLNDEFANSNFDFAKFEIKDKQYNSETKIGFFTATESIEYMQKFEFKYSVKDLKEIINSNQNIGEINNFDFDNPNYYELLSNELIYKNAEYKNDMKDFFENGQLELNIEKDPNWTNTNIGDKYITKMILNNISGTEVDQTEFRFYKKAEGNPEIDLSKLDQTISITKDEKINNEGIAISGAENKISFTSAIKIMEKADENTLLAYSEEGYLFALEVENKNLNIIARSQKFESNSKIKSILLTKNGTSLASTNDGLIYKIEINKDNNEFKFTVVFDESESNSKSLNSLVQLDNGDILVGTNYGSNSGAIYVLQEENGLLKKVKYETNLITNIGTMEQLSIISSKQLVWKSSENHIHYTSLTGQGSNSTFGDSHTNVYGFPNNLDTHNWYHANLKENDQKTLYGIGNNTLYSIDATSNSTTAKTIADYTKQLTNVSLVTFSKINHMVLASTSNGSFVGINSYDQILA